MGPMAKFYWQTWWVWLLIMIGFGVLAVTTKICVFWLLVPAIAVYSFYFGWVRVTDETRQDS